MLAGVLIFCGAFVRIVQWVHYRVLWIDEAQLAYNVATRTFAELVEPLSHLQLAPLGYLFLAKTLTLIFGLSEHAIRLPSIIGGVALLFLFYALARRISSPAAAVVGLAFMVVSKHLIYYSDEFKPYSLDAAWLMVLIALALSASTVKTLSLSRTTLFALVGAVVTWFSFSSAFVLAAIAIVQTVHGVARKDWTRLSRIYGAYACWGLSFALLYFISIGPIREASSATMLEHNSYWKYAGAFMPLPPDSVGDLKWFRMRLVMFFEMPGGFTMPGLAIFAWLSGVVSMYRRDRLSLAFLVMPIVVLLVASGFEVYAFHGRMTLFLVSIQFLLIGEGIAHIAGLLKNRGPLIAALLFVVLIGMPAARAARSTIRPISHHEMNRSLAYIQEHWKSGDRLYIRHGESLVYLYCKSGFDFDEQDCIYPPGPEPFATDLEHLAEELSTFTGRIWFPLVYDLKSHMEEIRAVINEHGTQVDVFHAAGSTALAYEFHRD